MRKFFLLSLLTIVLYSCGNGEYQKKEDLTNSKIFESSGNEQYLLPELPYWANFSTTGQCFRDQNIYYLDYKKVNASFNFKYSKIVHMQLLYNREIQKKKKEISAGVLSASMESRLFDIVYGKVHGGLKPLSLPNVDRVHLIWVDGAMSSDGILARLKGLIKGPSLLEGYPIFVSTCLSSRALEEWIEENELALPSFRAMGSEVFSIYNEDFEMSTQFNLNFSTFLGGKRRLFFFTPEKFISNGFSGELIIRNF